MSLLSHLIRIINHWQPVFCKKQAFNRSKEHAISALCALGRGTISSSIIFLGRCRVDHTADYRLYSTYKWKVESLFNPILAESMKHVAGKYIAVAVDDSRYRKTGKKIPGVSWQKDPLGPKFHTNLIWGKRFLQFSILLPLYTSNYPNTPPRALPIRFQDAPSVSKPPKKAPEEQWIQYRKDRLSNNLSTKTTQTVKELRATLDNQGYNDRTLLVVGDGSFANGTCFNMDVPRTEIIARGRKNAKLCYPAKSGGRRLYAAEKFTPESVRKDAAICWKEKPFFYGGEWHSISYKEVTGILWQSVTKTKPLRLIVLEPLPYVKGGKRNYRDPAYLLTTDLDGTADVLLQSYLDRWQIEVNFKEEKSLLGVGQSQVRHEKSVERRPALQVAAYSALMLASIEANGDQCNLGESDLPKWRKAGERPSTRSLIGRLREEVLKDPDLIYKAGLTLDMVISILKHAA